MEDEERKTMKNNISPLKKLFRFDDNYEAVYKFSLEAQGFVFYCSYLDVAIKPSDSDHTKTCKALGK